MKEADLSDRKHSPNVICSLRGRIKYNSKKTSQRWSMTTKISLGKIKIESGINIFTYLIYVDVDVDLLQT
jgi:hypothetical protein